MLRMLVLPLAIGWAVAQTPPRERVAGTVVDEHLRPLRDVAVCPILAGERPVAATAARSPLATTGADGRFEVAVPRLTRLWFLAEGRAHVAVHPSSHLQIVLPKAVTVAGRVVDAAGAPVAGVRVQAQDWLQVAPVFAVGSRLAAPHSWTATVTDAAGRFVMVGAAATALQVGLDDVGVVRRWLGPVAHDQPLELLAERFEPKRVRVLDPDGRPVVSGLVNWARDGCTRTDADGVAWSPAPAADVASCVHEVGDRRWSGEVSLRDSDRDPTLHLAPLLSDLRLPKVRVRAFAADRTPVREFRAAIVRASAEAHGSAVANWLVAAATDLVASADGVATVAPINLGEPQSWAIVDAPGQPLTPLPVEIADPLDVVLPPPCTIRGKVVDARTGSGIAGARVWTLPGAVDAEWHALEPVTFQTPLGFVVTAADGAFTLDRVPPGEPWLLVAHAGHLAPEPRAIVCAPDTPQTGIRLPLAPWLRIAGRTALHRQPGWVRLVRLRADGEPFDADGEPRRWPLAPDGTFRAEDIPPAEYRVQWLLPDTTRPGPGVPIDGPRVRLGIDATTLEVDLRASIPARVQGRIRGPEALSRFAVLSTGVDDRGAGPRSRRHHGVLVPVALDGTFAFLEPPGRRQRQVVDLLTGLEVARLPEVEVASASEVALELPVAVAIVDVDLVGGAQADGRELRVHRPDRGATEPDWRTVSPRCPLSPGASSVRLYAAPGTWAVSVLDARTSRPRVEATATVTLDASAPARVRLELPGR